MAGGRKVDGAMTAAEQTADFRQLGCGAVAYLRSFDSAGIAQLIPGAVAEPGTVTFILFDASGELLSFYHHVAAAMIDAAEADLAIATIQ
jgi:hypothetical protein